jgi:hypothetical protein
MAPDPSEARLRRRLHQLEGVPRRQWGNALFAVGSLCCGALLFHLLRSPALPQLLGVRLPASLGRALPAAADSGRQGWSLETGADHQVLQGRLRAADRGIDRSAEWQSIQTLLKALAERRIAVEVSSAAKGFNGGEWLPQQRRLRLRHGLMAEGTAAFSHGLAVQTAHVAQSCQAGGPGRSPQLLGVPIEVGPGIQERLDREAVPEALQPLELEAESLARQPGRVLALLAQTCPAASRGWLIRGPGS